MFILVYIVLAAVSTIAFMVLHQRYDRYEDDVFGRILLGIACTLSGFMWPAAWFLLGCSWCAGRLTRRAEDERMGK